MVKNDYFQIKSLVSFSHLKVGNIFQTYRLVCWGQVLPSMFITGTPVTAINNTFGLPTSEFPYGLHMVLYYHLDTLPVKDICSDSIIDAFDTDLFFAECFTQMKKVLKSSCCFLLSDLIFSLSLLSSVMIPAVFTGIFNCSSKILPSSSLFSFPSKNHLQYWKFLFELHLFLVKQKNRCLSLGCGDLTKHVQPFHCMVSHWLVFVDYVQHNWFLLFGKMTSCKRRRFNNRIKCKKKIMRIFFDIITRTWLIIQWNCPRKSNVVTIQLFNFII